MEGLVHVYVALRQASCTGVCVCVWVGVCILFLFLFLPGWSGGVGW